MDSSHCGSPDREEEGFTTLGELPNKKRERISSILTAIRKREEWDNITQSNHITLCQTLPWDSTQVEKRNGTGIMYYILRYHPALESPENKGLVYSLKSL